MLTESARYSEAHVGRGGEVEEKNGIHREPRAQVSEISEHLKKKLNLEYVETRASFHQPRLALRRGVVVVLNLLYVDLRTTVTRSRGKPLDREGYEIERGNLATFEKPEILVVTASE